MQMFDDVKVWFFNDVIEIKNVMLMFEEFMWCCYVVDMYIDWVLIYFGMLYLCVVGFFWFWSVLDGLCDEIVVDVSVFQYEVFMCNLFYKVMLEGEFVKVNLEIEEGLNVFLIMCDFVEQGYINYVVIFLSFLGILNNVMILVMMWKGGIIEDGKEQICFFIEFFVFYVEWYIV